MNVAEKSLENLLQEIGQLIGESLGQDAEGAFLYAEAAPGVMSAVVFKDVGDDVLAVFPSDELSTTLFEAWDLAEEDKKWGSLTYSIFGQQFEAQFEYPDKWNANEDYDDRLTSILAVKFGGKTIKYPQLDLDK